MYRDPEKLARENESGVAIGLHRLQDHAASPAGDRRGHDNRGTRDMAGRTFLGEDGTSDEPETRSRGLDLFEQLLALTAHGANDRLEILDRRPFRQIAVVVAG